MKYSIIGWQYLFNENLGRDITERRNKKNKIHESGSSTEAKQ